MRWVLVLLVLTACSKKQNDTDEQEVPPRLVLIEEDAAVDVQVIPIDPLDAGEVDACCGVPCRCGDEYERQLRCWQNQMYYCTPTGAPPGGDPTLYQQAVVVDICDDSGQPCVPDGPGDPLCEWEIIDIGECEGWLECDPTDPDIMVDENKPCITTDENGNEINGVQDFVCQKGKILAGPCVPCNPEECDGEDNDCDGQTDEGQYPCEDTCGQGTASCVNGELVGCNVPPPSIELCNSVDDDCDGDVDEELVRPCNTVCEEGVEFCVEGLWFGCTATQPNDEECNGMDDDCDGLTDEDLHCSCPPETVGFLMPCMEHPLVCGQGFKTCECVDENCTETQMTECLAMCSWLPEPGADCDPTLGLVFPEICNNFDDDCDQSIDEELVASCYSGPEETLNVGVCQPGELVCDAGSWGNYLDGLFIPDMCLGEKTPLPEDLCTGNDDNCDGVMDKQMEDTDVLFIVDTSGSMSPYINAVQQAMTTFSANYSDEEVIQWGLVVGPIDSGNDVETLVMRTNLVPFDQFLPVLANLDDNTAADEMLYDALYLSIRNLAPPLGPFAHQWEVNINSNPAVNNWVINWREGANHVVIVFTDEAGQTYMEPDVDQQIIVDTASACDDLSIYSFSKPADQAGNDGWEPVSVGGSWEPITSNSANMFDVLMNIIDETACGGSEEVTWFGLNDFQFASLWSFSGSKYEVNEPAYDRSTWLYLPTMQCISPEQIKDY